MPNEISLASTVYNANHAHTTILCLHGSESSQATWYPILEPLKNQYRIVTIDLRGHGDSPLGSEDFSIDQVIADIEQVVNKLGLTRFVIVAHSMAVSIALPYAVKHQNQVQGLVLEDLDITPHPKLNLNEQEIYRLKSFVKEHTTEQSVKDELARFGYGDRFNKWKKDGRIEFLKTGTY